VRRKREEEGGRGREDHPSGCVCDDANHFYDHYYYYHYHNYSSL